MADFPEPAVHSPTRLSLRTGAGPVLLWFFYKAFNCLSLFFFFPFKSLEVNTETNESRQVGLVWMWLRRVCLLPGTWPGGLARRLRVFRMA